jgi:N-acetylneuraminic acid mutarotase
MKFFRGSAAVWMGSICLFAACGMQMEDARGLDESPPHSEAPQSAAILAACTQESDCSPGLACVAGACQPCSGHSECASDVCDVHAATNLGPGACIPESDVVYVRAFGGPFCASGDGTRANPACSIAFGVPLAVGIRYALRVYPGRYFPFGIANRTVFVFGPRDGSAVVGEEDTSTAFRIEQGARVVLDGVDFDNSVGTGLVIEDSDVQVRNATVKGDSRGIRSTNSTLEIDRVRAIGHSLNALQVEDSGSYRITNSYFQGGGFAAVRFIGSSTGRFLFNTVTNNDGTNEPGGIDCGTTPRVIQDSIVVHNAAAPGGAQTVGACIHRRVVVGSADTRDDTGLIKIDPDLDAQGRLTDSSANDACCIDRGARFVSSLYRDFFGTPRPQGASNDIGAFERSWTTRAEIPTPREGYGAAAVHGILYYIAGDSEEGDSTINQAYDPGLDVWTTRASLPAAPRAELAAVSDGTYVYLIGGRLRPVSVSDELWRYDPAGDSWLQLASMPTARATEYMAAVDGGKIYVVGGRATIAPGSGRELNVVEAYDIASGTWATLAPMPEPRSDALVLARDGHLYVFGGYGPSEVANGNKTDTTFIFDIAHNTWSLGANLPPPASPSQLEPNGARVNLTGAVCNGRLHVIGGSGAVLRDSLHKNNWIYDPGTDRWRDGEPLLRGITEVQAVSAGGKIFVVGGGVLGLGIDNPINQAFTCPPPP